MGRLSQRPLLVAGLLLLGLAGGASAQTVRIGISEDPDVLDPAQGATFVGRIVFASFCDKLIDTDPKLNYVPQLATAWEWSPDNNALTLKLRPNVVFHDGTPLDAEAVKINIDRYRTADYSKRKAELKTVANVVVVDPLTVRLELSQPDAPLLSILADRAGMMLSPKAIASLGQNIATNPVCAGPLKFVERVPQQKIVFERFGDYWDKQNIHLQQVVYMPMTDVTVRTTNVRSGSVEIAERLQPTDLKELARDKRVKVVTSTALAYNTMSINMTSGPRAKTSVLAKDPRVREALELSLDREIIMQVVFGGEFVATNQPQAVDSPWFIKDRPIPGRDVERAKKLLAEAGVAKPSFTLSVTQNPVDGQIAQVIQSMAGEAGFDIKLEVLESNTLTGNTVKGAYEAATVIWSGRTDPDGNVSFWLACDGFLNWGKYCNKDVDAALAAARSKVNTTERLADYTKAAHIYLQERPHLFLFNHKWIWGLSARIIGFVPHPDGIIRLHGVKLGS